LTPSKPEVGVAKIVFAKTAKTKTKLGYASASPFPPEEAVLSELILFHKILINYLLHLALIDFLKASSKIYVISFRILPFRP
jgi:hypothetical protein